MDLKRNNKTVYRAPKWKDATKQSSVPQPKPMSEPLIESTIELAMAMPTAQAQEKPALQPPQPPETPRRPAQRGVKSPTQPAEQPKPTQNQKRKIHPVGRFFATLGVLLVLLVALLWGAGWVICKGPSPAARDLLVNTVMETSAAKFVARLYFTQEEIDGILVRNSAQEQQASASEPAPFEPTDETVPKDTIEIHEVFGGTYKGKMMVIYDPSRVQVATLSGFSAEGEGKRLQTFVEEANAVGGVNGGGFADLNGVGNGGMPLGIVIREGKLVFGSPSTESSVIGFNADNHLIVGYMSGQQALDRNMRDALSFGPAFIIDGKAVEMAGTGGGLNPRTVIGQRADGAVLLLVIDGRQPQSLGANYQDCIAIMQEWGAINAANLDGGSSTQMIYEGETINVCASLYGPRKLPTCIIVTQPKEDAT